MGLIGINKPVAKGVRHFLWPAMIAFSILNFSAVQAFDPATAGMAQFKAKQYKLAAVSLRLALSARPGDAALHYYYGACLYYQNDLNGAQAIFQYVVKHFPGSDAATRAQAAMDTFGQVSTPLASVVKAAPGTTLDRALQVKAGAGLQTAAGGIVTGPDECNIPFERIDNCLMLDVLVNDRRTKMMFDTGAESCMFSQAQLQELRIQAPSGSPTGKAGGVGGVGVQETWQMPVSLTLGPINRKHFLVNIVRNMAVPPLLGQTFFQDFITTIDTSTNNIHLRRRYKKQGAIYKPEIGDPNIVPFIRMGNEIMVEAEVNGHNCQVMFDTGASACAFTKAQVAKLGITVPGDAAVEIGRGIAGSSRSSVFPISSLRLGPIEKRDFEVHVMEDAELPAPLLGQTFYRDWQFKIDDEKKCIHFLRR
jgi:clan AA aspartic protease (TIGR02281 family)